jgi:CheY-like chemotaxis protein
MGGRIEVRSAPGKGSTFSFTARFGVASPSPRVKAARTDLHGTRVLVVDDNATNRRILEVMLGDWRMRPTAVDGAPAALAELGRAAKAGQPYPLVLLDAMMPGVDGLTLARQIRQAPALGRPVVLLLSSAGQPNASLADSGIAASLLKPVKPSDLLALIQSALGSKGNARPIPLSNGPRRGSNRRAPRGDGCASCWRRTAR